MVIWSTSDAGLFCYLISRRSYLTHPIRLHKTSYSAWHGARWNRKVRWVALAPLALFPLRRATCCMKKTGDESALLQGSFPGAAFT